MFPIVAWVLCSIRVPLITGHSGATVLHITLKNRVRVHIFFSVKPLGTNSKKFWLLDPSILQTCIYIYICMYIYMYVYIYNIYIYIYTYTVKPPYNGHSS